ncbi:hypothetical protein KIW84_076113 [Lathyrus oleraceus]|uniref:FAS1 domain-containing protein n=1 Tax=Pisum sativum TaxID=3888 RepID=A0A9D5A2X9_PEA|nr:hypothetical protein KIW84_076113 [Pisum sativum]
MVRIQSLLSLSLAILVSLLYSTTTTLSQLSPANAPIQPTLPAPTQPAASPKPLVPSLPESPTDSTPDTAGTAVDIVGILRKAKSFNVLIRLMKTTQLINQLNSQLLTTKTGGLTILAPDDSAFSELKAVRTLAGAKPGKVELNVVSYGGSVNISTGEVNTTINGIIYTDKHLAIYKVGKVLLPMDFFTVAKGPTKGPALAPEPSTATAKAPKRDKDISSDSSQLVNPNEQNSASVKIVFGKCASFGLIIATVAMMQT